MERVATIAELLAVLEGLPRATPIVLRGEGGAVCELGAEVLRSQQGALAGVVLAVGARYSRPEDYEETMRAWAAEFSSRYPDEAPDEVKFRAFLGESPRLPNPLRKDRIDLACSLLRVSDGRRR